MPRASRKIDTAPRQGPGSGREIKRARSPFQPDQPPLAPPASAGKPAVAAPESATPTKRELVLGLLRSENGASIQDLAAATGWLAHTTRAALTRLRQAGHEIQRSEGETGSVYRIAPPQGVRRARKAA